MTDRQQELENTNQLNIETEFSMLLLHIVLQLVVLLVILGYVLNTEKVKKMLHVTQKTFV